MKQALRELGMDDSTLQPRLALSRISHAKNRMEGPETFTANAWNPREQQIGKLYAMYVQALKDANALDFDDLLLQDRRAVREVRAGARTLQREVPVPDGRRVPGHEPPAVPADSAARRRATATCASSAIRTSRSTSGAAPTCGTSSTSSTTFPEAATVTLERNYRSTQVILDAASAVIAQNRNRKEKRLYTERAGRRARSSTTAPATTSTKPSSSPARRATALHDDAENTVAILYRTNAQSRTLEDALRRSGIAYKIIGGVRFYERKEIKDALAYLQARAQPARRRQPAPRDQRAGARHRQGRDGVARGGRARRDDAELPPLLAGLQPVATNNSLWARLVHAVDQRLLAAARARVAGRVPRSASSA